MGLSSSKQTTGPSKQALPYLTQASGALQDAYKANAPRLEDISSDLYSGFKDYSANMGQDLAGARGYAGDVLGGKYLTQGNPYLQGMIDQTNDSVSDRINALFSNAGQTGSTRQIGELGKQLANAENGLRYQNYGDEMNRMAQAAQLGLGINSAENSNAATQGALGASAAEIPYIGAEKLAQGLGGLWSNSQTTKSSGNLGQMLLQGAGAAAGAFAASDPRLKANVEYVGVGEHGLNLYRFDYIDPPSLAIAGYMRPGSHVGVMADEVAMLRPDALGPVVDGYQTIDYSQLEVR